MNEIGEPSPLYVRSRRGLLDVLEALGPHLKSVVLVGAQGVYMQVGSATEALSSFTKDADLMIVPALLSDYPAIEAVMRAAGFNLRDQPGLWFNASDAEVDLLVPASLAGKGRRSADLGRSHNRRAAMRVAGLEAALVDKHPMTVASFEPFDRRRFSIDVAGPAALLIAKLHKIGDRNDSNAGRLQNKDASDSFLLLRQTRADTLAQTFHTCLDDPRSSAVAQRGLEYLGAFFASANGVGLTLLRDSVAGLGDEETIVASCRALANELLSEIDQLRIPH